MANRQLCMGVISAALAVALFGCSAAEPSLDGDGDVVASSSEELSLSIASQLNGQMLTAPCLRQTEANVCQTVVNQCPPAVPTDPALSGALLTDKVVTVGGSALRTYSITLRIQGVVEAKAYTGSIDASGSATNGFATGGIPNQGNAYNVYMIRTNSPRQDYFLNSVTPPGVSNHTTYAVDYTATIRAKGQSTIRLVAADSNCSMIKNCGSTPVLDACNAPITLVPTQTARNHNPNFNFNVPSTGQWLVMTVLAVN